MLVACAVADDRLSGCAPGYASKAEALRRLHLRETLPWMFEDVKLDADLRKALAAAAKPLLQKAARDADRARLRAPTSRRANRASRRI